MEKLTLKLIDRKQAFDKDSKSTRNEYRIGNYRVYKDVTAYKNGHVYEQFYVQPNREMEYLPDIYFEKPIFSEGEKLFKIQTTSYGSKKAEDIQKIVEGYQEALEVVKVLTETFLKEGNQNASAD